MQTLRECCVRTVVLINSALDLDLNFPGARANREGNPLFVNPGSINFSLANGSAALDRGDKLLAPALDLNDVLRPGADNCVDIGAVEAPSSYAPPVDTIPPVSKMNPLPEFVATAKFNFGFIAADPQSGVKSVRLYYRFGGKPWGRIPRRVSSQPYSL